jgi:tetratricopeptide (TPR) repeat protein
LTARQTDDWAWIGANAGWRDCSPKPRHGRTPSRFIRDLERFRERFPEANVGLTAIVDELASRGHQRVHDGHVEAGIALLQESLSGARTQNRTDMVAQLHTEIGDLLLRQDDPRSAREHFEQAAALEPTTSDPRRSAEICTLDSATLHLRSATALRARFEFAAALGSYRVANEAEPGASLERCPARC